MTAIETDHGGDGTVSLQGALLPSAQIRFCAQNHVKLLNAPEAKLAIQDLFDAEGVLADQSATLAVRSDHVIAGAPVEARLQLSQPKTSIRAAIVWERIDGEPGDTGSDRDAVKRAIVYDGPSLGGFDLQLASPNAAGLYRLKLVWPPLAQVTSSEFVVRMESS
ncbi:MAG: hypothetical protein EON54_18635 [Alcaligenaceae bacterium]|nr:MAG: hypothetical protein EON54_18635 [Alcaligenaceae bacterium]